MYLQRSPNKSRTAIVIFYALCLLYILSAATVVSDLVAIILEVSTDAIYIEYFLVSCAVQFTIASTSQWHIVV